MRQIQPMSDKRLAEIRQGIEVGEMEMDHDEAFWAIRNLLDEVDRLRETLKASDDEVARQHGIITSYASDELEQKDCTCREAFPFGHADNCPVLARLIEAHRLPSGDYE